MHIFSYIFVRNKIQINELILQLICHGKVFLSQIGQIPRAETLFIFSQDSDSLQTLSMGIIFELFQETLLFVGAIGFPREWYINYKESFTNIKFYFRSNNLSCPTSEFHIICMTSLSHLKALGFITERTTDVLPPPPCHKYMCLDITIF